MNVEYEASDLKEPLSLWSIPFTLLLIMLILAAADVLFPFIPLEISHGTWMWAFSTMITTICASLVAEKLSMDRKRAVVSMAGAAAFSILFYRGISSFLQRSLVNSIQSIIPNPFVEMAVYTSVLTIIPGALVGVIFGGVLGSLPIRISTKRKVRAGAPHRLQLLPLLRGTAGATIHPPDDVLQVLWLLAQVPGPVLPRVRPGDRHGLQAPCLLFCVSHLRPRRLWRPL
jgi:hypothetical protein